MKPGQRIYIPYSLWLWIIINNGPCEINLLPLPSLLKGNSTSFPKKKKKNSTSISHLETFVGPSTKKDWVHTTVCKDIVDHDRPRTGISLSWTCACVVWASLFLEFLSLSFYPFHNYLLIKIFFYVNLSGKGDMLVADTIKKHLCKSS